jgi:hypothetical protein
MANYIVNYQKKIRIRQEKEDKLCRLIARDADEAKLLLAAAIVRDSRIRELRAKRSQISPADTDKRDEQLAKIDARIQKTQSTMPEAILLEFRPS